MLSCGVGKVLPDPTVGAKCSYPTRVEIVRCSVGGNRVDDVESNGDPKDSPTLKSVRVQKSVFKRI